MLKVENEEHKKPYDPIDDLYRIGGLAEGIDILIREQDNFDGLDAAITAARIVHEMAINAVVQLELAEKTNVRS